MKTNVIYNEDCLETMRRMPARSVDLIITSPPYNIGVEYDGYEDNMPNDEYMDFLMDFGRQCKVVLKYYGLLFLNVGTTGNDEFRATDIARAVGRLLKLQNTFHWVKHIAVPDKGINIGPFKPINSDRYVNNCHEYIYQFSRDGMVPINKLGLGVPFVDKRNMQRFNHESDLRDRGNQWFIPYEAAHGKKEHPALFPEALPEMCIKITEHNDRTVVYDPFMGVGTTCVVARRMGCQYIGSEISPTYYNIARDKLKEQIIA